MNRRRFLQTIGALAATPAVAPLMPAFSGAATVTAETYRWAEVIVRAHKTCSPAMLQRTLQLSPAMAEAVQSKLIANGVLGANANTWGMYQATNPLFDGLFRPADIVAKTHAKSVRTTMEQIQHMDDDGGPKTDSDRLASPDIVDAPPNVTVEMLYDEAQWLEGQRIVALV